jgi:hypothetical protein
VRAETATLGASSGAAGVLADQVSVQQGGVQVLVSKGDVSAEQSGVGVLVTQHATLKQSGVVFLIAQRVEGDVRALFGPVASAVFGAAFGAAAAVVFLLMRRKQEK